MSNTRKAKLISDGDSDRFAGSANIVRGLVGGLVTTLTFGVGAAAASPAQAAPDNGTVSAHYTDNFIHPVEQVSEAVFRHNVDVLTGEFEAMHITEWQGPNRSPAIQLYFTHGLVEEWCEDAVQSISVMAGYNFIDFHSLGRVRALEGYVHAHGRFWNNRVSARQPMVGDVVFFSYSHVMFVKKVITRSDGRKDLVVVGGNTDNRFEKYVIKNYQHDHTVRAFGSLFDSAGVAPLKHNPGRHAKPKVIKPPVHKGVTTPPASQPGASDVILPAVSPLSMAVPAVLLKTAVQMTATIPIPVVSSDGQASSPPPTTDPPPVTIVAAQVADQSLSAMADAVVIVPPVANDSAPPGITPTPTLTTITAVDTTPNPDSASPGLSNGAVPTPAPTVTDAPSATPAPSVNLASPTPRVTPTVATYPTDAQLPAWVDAQARLMIDRCRADYPFALLAARKYNRPVSLILAQAYEESNCRLTAKQKNGLGVGAMEVDTGAHPNYTGGLDPLANFMEGTRILDSGLRHFEKMGLAPALAYKAGVAAYNEGIGGAEAAIKRTGDPASGTTHWYYTEHILAHQKIIHLILASQGLED